MRNSWGLTLFLRQGLVAWMRAWPPEQITPAPRAVDRLEHRAMDLPEPSLPLGTQIVLIVADMILHRPREVRT